MTMQSIRNEIRNKSVMQPIYGQTQQTGKSYRSQMEESGLSSNQIFQTQHTEKSSAHQYVSTLSILE